ncbi:MAG: hypothetical protein HG456_003475 [candidate division SR1 bacterium]|nr:hypothetical protein [candidate division SR1 bacterium]
MKSVVNISSDQIAIWHLGEMRKLERNGVDREIGKVLVELDREGAFDQCLVINGPGGFTNLRVGSLALNLLKTLKGDQISFFSLSKPELYKMAYDLGLLPRWILMYIGQKNNVWLRDLEEQKMEKMVKKSEKSDLEQELGELAIDMVYDDSYFSLEGEEKNDGNQISYFFDEEKMTLVWKGKSLSFPYADLMKNAVEKLEANYMMDPNVG